MEYRPATLRMSHDEIADALKHAVKERGFRPAHVTLVPILGHQQEPDTFEAIIHVFPSAYDPPGTVCDPRT